MAVLVKLYQAEGAQSAAGSGSAAAGNSHRKQRAKKPKRAAAGSGSGSGSGSAGAGPLIPRGLEEASAPSKLTALQQKAMDALYQDVDIPHVDLLVRSADQNGLGDLINGLQTSRLLLAGTNWTVAIDSNHPGLGTMLPSFPGVEEGELEDGYHKIALETPGMVGMEDRLVVTEYGYRTAKELNEYTRSSGLRDHDIGIMSDLGLRQPLALSELNLSQPHLREVLSKHAQGWRFFFGYGAGQKERARYDLLLDRVIFDPKITHAIVLPVNHHTVGEDTKKGQLGVTYLQRYLEKRKVPLSQLQLKRGKSVEFGTLTVDTLSMAHREIKVVAMKPKQLIVYSDIRQLWRAADRSFTIAEGDQSFSEALSAGIPMAYQLWRTGGNAHKKELYDSFVKQCGGVAEFIERCAEYPENDLKHDELMKIIADCNRPEFLRRYSEFAMWLVNQYDIAPRLRGFVKRYWIRNNVRALAREINGLGEAFGEIFALEASDCFFNEAVESTRKMLAAHAIEIGRVNVRWNRFGRRDAVRKSMGGPSTGQGIPAAVLELISEYDQPRVLAEAPPSAFPLGATATAAAGTAPVGASAAAAAGALPAPPKSDPAP